MANLVSALDSSAGIVYGENGAPAIIAMGNNLVLEAFSKDLVRGRSIDVKNIWSNARRDEKAYLVLLIAYARCIKNGAGERALYYQALLDLYLVAPKTVLGLIPLLPNEECLGNWKDFERIALAANKRTEDFKPLIKALSKHHAKVLYQDWLNVIHDTMDRSVVVTLAGKYASTEGCAGWKVYGNMTAFHLYNLIPHLKAKHKSEVFCSYRKVLSQLRQASNVVERKLCTGDLESIDFSKVPSGAMRILGKLAFKNLTKKKEIRHESPEWIALAQRFEKFLAKVNKGEEKIHGGRLQIHQFPGMFDSPHDASCGEDVFEAQAADFIETLRKECAQRAKQEGSAVVDLGKTIVMADVSGSMCTPIAGNVQAIQISTIIGWVVSQIADPAWRDRVMTFSEHPTWVDLSNHQTHRSKYHLIKRAPWGCNTNFEAAFEMVLQHALKAKLSSEDMEGVTLLVASDMQFDIAKCRSGDWETTYQTLARRFKSFGFPVPRLIFWNLAARETKGFVVSFNISGVITMSGFGVGQLKDLLAGKDLHVYPLDNMLRVFHSDHFKPIREVVVNAGEFPIPPGFLEKRE